MAVLERHRTIKVAPKLFELTLISSKIKMVEKLELPMANVLRIVKDGAAA